MTEQELLNSFLSMAVDNMHFKQAENAIALGADVKALSNAYQSAIRTANIDTAIFLSKIGFEPLASDFLYFARQWPIDNNKVSESEFFFAMLNDNAIRQLSQKPHGLFSDRGAIYNLILNSRTDSLKLYLEHFCLAINTNTEWVVAPFKLLSQTANKAPENHLSAFDTVLQFLIDNDSLSRNISALNNKQRHLIESALITGINEEQFAHCQQYGLLAKGSRYRGINGVRNPNMLHLFKQSGLIIEFIKDEPYPYMNEKEYISLGANIVYTSEEVALDQTMIATKPTTLPSIHQIITMAFNHVAALKENMSLDALIYMFAPIEKQYIGRFLENAFTTNDFKINKDESCYPFYEIFIAALIKKYNIKADLGTIIAHILSKGVYPANCTKLAFNNNDDPDLTSGYMDMILAPFYIRSIIDSTNTFRRFIGDLNDPQLQLLMRKTYQRLGYKQNKTVNQLCAGLNKTTNNSASQAHITTLLLCIPKTELVAAIPKVRIYDTMILILALLDISPMDALSDENITLNSQQRSFILQSLAK